MSTADLTENLPAPLDQLVSEIYQELRQIAHLHRNRERPDVTLHTTALVHEAYIRMARSEADLSLQDRQHLRSLTSRIIRHVLVDYARRGRATKRNVAYADPEALLDTVIEPMLDVTVLDLDAALHGLARYSPRMEKVVECRFFGGMNVAETAEVLGISIRAVERDWQHARLYLMRLLDGSDDGLARGPGED